MLTTWSLFALSMGYVGLLFAIAYLGDRHVRVAGAPLGKPWIYSLALGVYCTSWTFYGAVGRAATSGWDFLPIYLGPALVFILGAPLLSAIVRISKRHNITSVADFIGARYGHHQPVAVLITLLAVVGVLPYIALQLKAVAFGFEALSGVRDMTELAFPDGALLVAMMLAAFAILFGTREVVSSENHHGMVLAIAFESVVKLVAFLAVGLYATYVLRDGLGDAYRHALELPQLREPLDDSTWRAGFVAQTILAGVAIFCLPRQFHVTVVESTATRDLRAARWIFPTYLALISLFVVPIAAAGLERFRFSDVHADTFVLALPQVDGHLGLTLASYIGGFSAATGMVIVETIALSTMICNEIVMPALLRTGQVTRWGKDLSGLIKAIRRVAIALLVALAYVYYRLFTGPGTLSQIGLLSFAAVSQFAPSIVGGVVWKRGRFQGVIGGVLVGAAFWVYTLLVPELLTAQGPSMLVAEGPFQLGWLKPRALFGITGLDPITHGTLLSLAANILVYVVVSLWTAPSLRDRLHAARFLERAAERPAASSVLQRAATVGDLQELLECFVGPDRARALLAEYAARDNVTLNTHDRADNAFARFTEHVLAGALGASSARFVLETMLKGRNVELEDVVKLLDETSHLIHFNRELLRAALEHLPHAVSVVDSDFRLVAWNQRYAELFRYPPSVLVVGRPIEELMRYNADQGLLAGGDVEQAIARRLSYMRAGNPHKHERELSNGVVVEICGNAMPGGGFVTSYTDVTAYKRTERALQDANEMLEVRVADRTRQLTTLNLELASAKSAAERANYSKTRFLAAASHDLVQPITAARLFMSSLDPSQVQPRAAELVLQSENALSAAEGLLAGLLDISRLDAGAQEVRLEHFALETVVGPLGAEFHVLARQHGLSMKVVGCGEVVYSDPRLLRRVLQNFLSNAVRYTRKGKVLVGCRRDGDAMRIEVWDTGPGIPGDKLKEIFEEFRRLDMVDANGERGLGLGLAIAERIARMLHHRLAVRSWPGVGSVFSITVPRGERNAMRAAAERPPGDGIDPLAGTLVMCLENEAMVRAGIEALLTNWGCRVIAVPDRKAALAYALSGGDVPDLLIVDYHLDGGVRGIDVARAIETHWARRVPGVVISADHTQDARQAAEQEGYQVLPKPVKPAALRAMLSRLLA